MKQTGLSQYLALWVSVSIIILLLVPLIAHIPALRNVRVQTQLQSHQGKLRDQATKSPIEELIPIDDCQGLFDLPVTLVIPAPIHMPDQLFNLAYSLSEPPLGSSKPAGVTFPTITVVLTGGILLLIGLVWWYYRQNQRIGQSVKMFERQNQELRCELANQKNRYEQVLHNASDGLFFIDLETGKLLDINRRAEQLLGYSHAEIERLTLKTLFPRPYRYRFWRLVASVKRHDVAMEDELQFQRKDGSLFVGAIQVRAGRLGDRRVAHGSFRDVTPTVNLALELRRHNRRLSLLNEISHRVAEGHDLPATLEIVLDQVVDSLGVSGGGIYLVKQQGTDMQLAIHRNIPADVLHDLQGFQPGEGLVGKVASTGRPRLSTDLQIDHRRLSLSVVKDHWHAFLAVPMIAEEQTLGVLFIFDRGSKVISREDVRLMQAIGRQVGPLVKNAELIDELQWQQRLNEASMREIERSRTALRDNLAELEHTHHMLESLDQMKSTFLGLASHELRTPLTTILCGAELLETLSWESLGDNSKRALEAILQGSLRLNQIVNELLEAARLEARALYLASEVFDPKPVVNSLLANKRNSFMEHQLECRLEMFPENVRILGDAHHLSRALERILENAIKFTPPGGQVRIEGHILSQVEVIQQEERLKDFSETFFQRLHAEHYLTISIHDTGVGLASSEQKRVFEKFYEVGDIATHSSSKIGFGGKGVGLGLTLVKGIIEAHDGMVWVESAGEHQGSCFSVLLPIRT